MGVKSYYAFIFRYRIGRTFLVLAVLTFFVAAGIFGIGYANITNMQSSYDRQIEDAFAFYSNDFYNKLHRLDNLSVILSNDINILSLNQSKFSLKTLYEYNNIINEMHQLAGTADIYCNLFVYFYDHGRLLSSQTNYDKIGPGNDILPYVKTFGLNHWFYREYTRNGVEKTTLTFIATQIGVYGESRKGLYTVIDINVSEIQKILGSFAQEADVFLIVGDTVITSTKVSKQLSFYQQQIQDDDRLAGVIKNLKDPMGRQQYNVLFRKNNVGEDVIGLRKVNQLDNSVTQMLIVSIASFAVLVLILLFFVLSVYRNMLKPLIGLSQRMKEVNLGDLSVRLPVEETGDVAFMFRQFNSMVEQLDRQIKQTYRSEMTRKQNQLKLLQSQINPHFLYNCLNFIYQSSMADNSDAAAEMALYLSKYYRYMIRFERDDVRLLEELDAILVYIHIYGMQYPDILECIIDIPEGMKDIVIPKLTLQPLIENVMVHGLSNRSEKSEIHIRGTEGSASWLLVVENTGITLSDSEIKSLNENINREFGDKGSYGLNNVLWRLKLRFNETASLRIACSGNLTSVKIEIPKLAEDSNV